MHVLHLLVAGLQKADAEKFEAAALGIPEVLGIDTWPGRASVTVSSPDDAPSVISSLLSAGFVVTQPQDAARRTTVRIAGMTCRSCEITIERRLKKLPGVERIAVDATKGTADISSSGSAPSLADIRAALNGTTYAATSIGDAVPAGAGGWWRIAGLFAIVIGLGAVLGKLGLFELSTSISSATFAGAVVLGLVAGSSSCLAVSGGLLLSSAGKFRERYGSGTLLRRTTPVFLFIAGRTASYALFGGTIGALGKAFTLPPIANGIITVAAAAAMIVLGLDMLKIAPPWLMRLVPRLPKAIGHRIFDAEGRAHPLMPAILGGATFFLPCGFTQSLQLYALTTGSFAAGAAMLGGFAVGTAPALLALGWASTSLRGKAGSFFFRLAGATAVILGILNVQNGLIASGLTLELPRAPVGAAQAADPNVAFDGTTQIIRMSVSGKSPFYSPSDQYTVLAGVPVRMEIKGVGTGCRSVFQIAKLGVSTLLDKSVNVLEFTPKEPGKLTFSCSMGMFRGTIDVVPHTT